MALRCAFRVIEKNKLGFDFVRHPKVGNIINETRRIDARLFSIGQVSCAKQTDEDIFKRSVQIYAGTLSSNIRGIKVFSLLTSGVGIILQPILIERYSQTPSSIPVLVAIGTFIGFFTYVTPILLHLITKRYVVSLHYNEDVDMYIAKTYTLFLRSNLLYFRHEDVVVPDLPGLFTSFIVKGQPLFVEMELFQDIEHYRRIMGYDKPVDFKLHVTPESLKQPDNKK